MRYAITPYKITLWLLMLCFVTGFLQRFTEAANKFTLFFFLVSSVATISIINNQKKSKLISSEAFTILIVVLLAGVLSLIYFLIPNFIFALLSISVFIIPLGLLHKLSYEEKIKIIRFVLLVSFFQIFVDIIYPNKNYSELDQYCGLFNSGNNKARFLVFSILIVIGCYYNKKVRSDIFKSIKINRIVAFSIPVLISFYLGHSGMSLIFLLLGILFAVSIKKLKWFLVVNAVLFSALFIYTSTKIQELTNYDQLWWVYYRFFDPNNGIMSAYIYGFDVLKDSNFLGAGLGNFATRAAIFFETSNAYGYPAVNIVDVKVDFNKYNAINYPDWGMNPFYLYFIEISVLVIPVIYIFFNKMWKHKANNLVGLASFYFLFYVINYWPQFFDEFFSYLYLSIFILINDIFRMEHKQEKVNL